jgi:formamidopyrimidine-DNA glycosylase
MPELPEVETLKRALSPLILNKRLLELRFLRKDLRFPIPSSQLRKGLLNQTVSKLTREGKYILVHTPEGALLLHLGMSGRVTQSSSIKPVEKHTHAIFQFEQETYLHYIDPRRFGCLLWIPKGHGHPLLDGLGPDPLGTEITAKRMKLVARNCSKASIKSFLMDAKRIAGVGNIYACESLFAAGIHPQRPARLISTRQWELLLSSLRKILEKSIAAGGTTLRDFHSIDGSQGYYKLSLAVYGKENLLCPVCSTPVKRFMQSARSTFFCKTCQKK